VSQVQIGGAVFRALDVIFMVPARDGGTDVGLVESGQQRTVHVPAPIEAVQGAIDRAIFADVTD
jgi:hypothetical protein